MDKKTVGLIFLSLTTVFFLLGTVFMSLAWVGESEDSDQWRNTVEQKNETIENLQSTLESKDQNISELQDSIDVVKSEKEVLQSKVDQPLIFASALTWAEGIENDVQLTFSAYNFGNTQATDVKAKFIVYESSTLDKIKETKVVDVGNIASRTIKDLEYSFDLETEIESHNKGYVIINACENCLKLSHRIDSLSSDINIAESNFAA